MPTDRFYSDLPTNSGALSALLADPAKFHAVPPDWQVILTDVRKSTQALSNGKHQQVNLVATGSIIAALNIAHRAGVALPFFFGGDGATLLAPEGLAAPIEAALLKHRENTQTNFALDLRVGRVPVAELYAQGASLSIAKTDVNSQGLVIPLALGEGLQLAERIVKSEDFATPQTPADAGLDLEGMECRWDAIRPQSDTQEIVCLLVTVRQPERQAAILSAVLKQIELIYGSLAARNPVSQARLKLTTTIFKIATEMRAKLGRFDPVYLFGQWLYTLIGPLYFAFSKDGGHYLERVVQLSDTLMIDGRVNTVISGTAQQRQALTAALRTLEVQGEIRFGLQICAASVMSCYVRDRRDQHIHFVDGLGGGYTQAATMLKQKMAREAGAGP